MECPNCHFDNPDDALKCSKCAAPLPSSKEISVTETLETPAEELTTGSTFAERYQIIEELGKGGMGKVYKALDTKINEKIALKLIKPEIASDKKTIERFGNELKFARKIVHKNVGRMFDINEDKGTHYITMEYVSGQDLKGLIRQSGRLVAGTSISLAKQVCEGLAEAHKLGVIHRDLKPSNIMVDKEGKARIMDFGIARSLKSEGITGTGIMIGTPEYMSPEQAEAKDVDQRSDIYSVGVILYEMLTGKVPFEGDTPLSVAMKHKGEIPKDPRELNAQIPKDMSHLILKCLEKYKEKRYQSAEELASELVKIEESVPAAERIIPRKKPITSKEITVKFKLKKLLIPSLAFVTVIVALVIIMQFLPKETAIKIDPNKPSLAILYFKNNTGDEGLDHWRNALAEWLITDISQSKYIDVLPDNRLFSILRQMKLLEAENYATEDLQKIADEGNVNHLIQASYSKAGDIFRIDYSLLETESLSPIGSDSVRGEGEKSFPGMLDELTRKIKQDLKFSEREIARDIDLDVGIITTSSPEAYRFYSEGRKYHNSGDYDQSRFFMREAIKIDPEFAMAYRSIAATGQDEEENLKKALEFSDRVSDRERYLIEAGYFENVERNYNKAIEAYSKLLELYPDDFVGNGNLGVLFNSLEEPDKSLKYTELAYQKNKASLPIIHNLALNYADKGMFAKAKEIANYYLNNVADNPFVHIILWRVYYVEGKYELALEEADKISALNPNRRYQGWIYYLMGDYSSAEEEFKANLGSRSEFSARSLLQNVYITQGKFKKAEEQLISGLEKAKESEATRNNILWIARFHNELAYIYLLKGNLEEALKNAEIGWKRAEEYKFDPYQWRASIIKAYAYSKMKLFNEAFKVAEELKEAIEKIGRSKQIRFHYLVIGLIELERGNVAQSIKYLKEASSLDPKGPQSKAADIIDALAFAYYKAGDLKAALKEYEKIPLLTYYGRYDYGYIYARSFYMLGKIYEELGNTARAIEHYEKFLDLWKDADPGMAEVEDAKKRLAGLKAS